MLEDQLDADRRARAAARRGVIRGVLLALAPLAVLLGAPPAVVEALDALQALGVV